jgi:hypothetical protein
MKLHIAGFNHFDPTGRTRLRQWLEQLSATHSEPPAFVAVEWDEGLFAKVKAQRSMFRNLMEEEWPRASPGLLDELELSLGYGGDTHCEVFSGAKAIWLDQGRSDDVEPFAWERLNMYRSFLGQRGLPQDASSGLSILGQEAWERAGPPSEGDVRDRKFARLVLDEIAQSGGGWGIAIVGVNHASANPGYMRRLLEDAEQLCEVTILR